MLHTAAACPKVRSRPRHPLRHITIVKYSNVESVQVILREVLLADKTAGMMQHGRNCLKGRDRFDTAAVSSGRLGDSKEYRRVPHDECSENTLHAELASKLWIAASTRAAVKGT